MPTDPQVGLSELLIVLVILSSAFLWMHDIREPKTSSAPESKLNAWPIGWVNFGIFICSIIGIVFILQNLAVFLFLDEAKISELDDRLTIWIPILGIFFQQIPVLIVIYLIRRFYPAQFADQINVTYLSILGAFRKTIPIFIKYVPIVWLSSLIWAVFLLGLVHLGLIDEFEPQKIIQQLQQGADPITLFLSAIMITIMAPVVEEILFRGFIYRFFKSQTTLFAAQFLSAVLFALIHNSLLAFVPILILGILLAKIYERAGNLLVPIFFHAFFNSFTLISMYLMASSPAS